MSIADDWRNLATDFERLDPELTVVVWWKYFPATKVYTFGTIHEVSANLVEAKFRALCARCGEILDMADSFFDWLIQVKLHSQNDMPGSGVTTDPVTGQEMAHISGRINRPAEACAALCYRMEAYERSCGSAPCPILRLADDPISPPVQAQRLGPVQTQPAAESSTTKRFSSMLKSDVAAAKMAAYIQSNGGVTRFSIDAQTDQKTIRKFKNTGTIRRDKLEDIAKAMKTTVEFLTSE